MRAVFLLNAITRLLSNILRYPGRALIAAIILFLVWFLLSTTGHAYEYQPTGPIQTGPAYTPNPAPTESDPSPTESNPAPTESEPAYTPEGPDPEPIPPPNAPDPTPDPDPDPGYDDPDPGGDPGGGPGYIPGYDHPQPGDPPGYDEDYSPPREVRRPQTVSPLPEPEPRPFLTTPFEDYTVTEGFLLLIALLLSAFGLFSLVRRFT